MISDAQLLRYSRHILLNKWDISGQENILAARVLVIGCGGLAHPALAYLASSGVGQIDLVDDDVVEASNLQRQFWFSDADIGQPKAEVLQRRLQTLNPDVRVFTTVRRADEDFLNRYIPLADAVLDCTDNYASRCLINRCCFRAQKPLVSASALEFSGQLAVYDFRDGKGPCYQCLFDGDWDDGASSCAKNGVFSPLLGIMGAAQAAETLKLLAHIAPNGETWLHCFDAVSFRWQRIQVACRPNCPVCGHTHKSE